MGCILFCCSKGGSYQKILGGNNINTLQKYGFTGSLLNLPTGLIPARIIAIHRKQYTVICEHGELIAHLTGSFLHKNTDRSALPAVGDFILLCFNTQGSSSITDILPRRSKFSRTDYSGHAVGYVKTILEQVVAANFDYVFIISSLNQDFNLNRIARYLTQARQSGGIPVIILTKSDLVDDYQPQIDAIRSIVEDVDIVPVSSHTGAGLDLLNPYLQPYKTIVFLGMSGVGKSSLLNALSGEELMVINDIRTDDARGRHTTTHRELVRLLSGVMIIDTPGMRELGLWNANEGIKESFGEIEKLISQCRFSDCRHRTEPDCAIQSALADGRLTQNQWNSYITQKKEAIFVSRKSQKKKK